MRGQKIIVCLLLAGSLISCTSNVKKQKLADSAKFDLSQKPDKSAGQNKNRLRYGNKNSVILALTKKILTEIKNHDYESLAAYIHPTLGIRFSPYANIDTVKNVKLSKAEFIAQTANGRELSWGNYDGSGDPIRLSIEEYFKKFVYDADFLDPEKLSINRTIGKSNIANNLEAVYKGCDYTESYFSGWDKKNQGMDWCALRLVFKNYNGGYHLVGIVHDQWAI